MNVWAKGATDTHKLIPIWILAWFCNKSVFLGLLQTCLPGLNSFQSWKKKKCKKSKAWTLRQLTPLVFRTLKGWMEILTPKIHIHTCVLKYLISCGRFGPKRVQWSWSVITQIPKQWIKHWCWVAGRLMLHWWQQWKNNLETQEVIKFLTESLEKGPLVVWINYFPAALIIYGK